MHVTIIVIRINVNNYDHLRSLMIMFSKLRVVEYVCRWRDTFTNGSIRPPMASYIHRWWVTSAKGGLHLKLNL